MQRVVAALRRSLPELSEQEFLWRVHFMVGAMAHTMCGYSDGLTSGEAKADFSGRIALLITFLNAGLRAPATREEKGK
jgi:hypothetical protein